MFAKLTIEDLLGLVDFALFVVSIRCLDVVTIGLPVTDVEVGSTVETKTFGDKDVDEIMLAELAFEDLLGLVDFALFVVSILCTVVATVGLPVVTDVDVDSTVGTRIFGDEDVDEVMFTELAFEDLLGLVDFAIFVVSIFLLVVAAIVLPVVAVDES